MAKKKRQDRIYHVRPCARRRGAPRYTASLQLRTLLPPRGLPPPFMRSCRGSLPRPAVLLQGWARGRGAQPVCKASWRAACAALRLRQAGEGWLRSVVLMNVCDPSSCTASQFTSLVGTVRRAKACSRASAGACKQRQCEDAEQQQRCSSVAAAALPHLRAARSVARRFLPCSRTITH